MTTSSRGLLAALIVAAPVLVGITHAMLAAFGLTGLAGIEPGWGRAHAVLTDVTTWRSLAWSLWAAAASTVLAFAGAVLIASLFRSSSRTDALARALATLPLAVPHVAAAFVGLLILGQSGVLARISYAFGWIATPADFPALVYDPAGTAFIMTLAAKELPFLALIAFSLLASETDRLEETARSLGAGPLEVFRHVTFPLLWRGLLPATVAVFVFVFGTYEAAAMLGPSRPTPLPVLAMERYAGASLAQRADAFVLSLLALVLALAAVAAHELLRRRRWEVAG
ncbi:MAG: ABC transporter permease subunit [Gemmatimonadota bacterium]